jgi:hypothetical protein
VILGFCCEVDENCVLLGFYAASSGNFLATCQDNLLSVRIYHYSLRNNPEERNSHLRIPLFCYMTPNFETIMCLWRVGVRLSIGDATSDYPLSDYPLTTQRRIIHYPIVHWRRNVILSIIRLSIDDATSDYPLSIDDVTSDYPLSDYPLMTQRQIPEERYPQVHDCKKFKTRNMKWFKITQLTKLQDAPTKINSVFAF